MKTISLTMPNISCHHCLMTIKRESSFVAGVEFVGGDVAGKTATFQVESEAALDALKKALAEAGYPTSDTRHRP